MKVGRNGSFVDKGGAGGMLAGIDSKSGIFNTVGQDDRDRVWKYVCVKMNFQSAFCRLLTKDDKNVVI